MPADIILADETLNAALEDHGMDAVDVMAVATEDKSTRTFLLYVFLCLFVPFGWVYVLIKVLDTNNRYETDRIKKSKHDTFEVKMSKSVADDILRKGETAFKLVDGFFDRIEGVVKLAVEKPEEADKLIEKYSGIVGKFSSPVGHMTCSKDGKLTFVKRKLTEQEATWSKSELSSMLVDIGKFSAQDLGGIAKHAREKAKTVGTYLEEQKKKGTPAENLAAAKRVLDFAKHLNTDFLKPVITESMRALKDVSKSA